MQKQASDQHFCDLCKHQIEDIVYYPCSVMLSPWHQNVYNVDQYENYVRRTCGHQFHENCCTKTCPICKQYFVETEKLYLKRDLCVDEKIERISVKCYDIFNTLTALSSDPLISESHRQYFLSSYYKEVKVLFDCFSQIYQFRDLPFPFTLPPASDFISVFRKPNISLFNPHISITNLQLSQIHCQRCKRALTTEFTVCLICNKPFHSQCAHSCNKLLFFPFQSIISTTQFVLKYFPNGNENLNSLIVCNLILCEPSLKRTEEWVVFVRDYYSDEEGEFEEEVEETE
ncbi:Hypothetical_protein [Hexamita inflata]|uniref:Hypothetical_protein n=1 Tax=Hexamita inflata TaxID=28002 RepID=A0ABP1GXI9_9EUKA